MTHAPPIVSRRASLRGGRRWSRRRGSTVMEAALVFPLLIYLGFGVVEYGYYLYAKNTLQGAARDGAREAMLSTCTNATVQSAVDTSMSASGMTGCGYAVTTSPASVTNLASGSAVTCTVTATWGNFHVHPLPIVFGGIPTTKQVTCSVVMRRE